MSEHKNNDPAPGNDEHLQSDPGAPPNDKPAQSAGEVTSDDRTMAMLCHLLAIFTGFIGPLIIWLVKKDQSAFVDHHGKESLNFQITVLIAYLISYVLVFAFFLGCVLMPAVLITALVLCIMASMAANNGQLYRYPWSIRFIK